MTQTANPFIGCWRLVHSISIDAEGTQEYPFGADAHGYIYYTEAGVMAVQIARRGRAVTTDLARLHHEYLAYFGRYEIDLDRKVIRHLLEAQLFPGEHPDLLERRYHFDGTQLALRPLDGTKREILWERVTTPASRAP